MKNVRLFTVLVVCLFQLLAAAPAAAQNDHERHHKNAINSNQSKLSKIELIKNYESALERNPNDDQALAKLKEIISGSKDVFTTSCFTKNNFFFIG